MRAISAVFNPEERSTRERKRSLDRLANELALYVRARRCCVSVILQRGNRLAYAKPGTAQFQQLTGDRGAILIGTYLLCGLSQEDWLVVEDRMKADLEVAISEYYEGRLTSPGEPGQYVTQPPEHPAVFRRKR
jgi:hypothetical protein